MMKIDLTKYFPCEVMRKAAGTRNQIVAMSLPFIIQNESDEYNLVYGDKGLVYLSNKNGERFKVFSTSSNKCNIFPSFTKGFGRDAKGVQVKKELTKEGVDYVMLVSVKDMIAEVSYTKTRNISDSGILHV